MKLRIMLPFIALLILTGLGVNSVQASPLMPESDTLILKTEKHKGCGLFERISIRLNMEEIPDHDELLNLIPSSISNPKLAWEVIDMNVFAYHRIKNNNPEDLDKFIKGNYPEKIDPASFPSEHDNSFRIIVGMKDLDDIYILDENNNNDFRDDPVRILSKMNFDAPAPEPVKFHYWIHNGKETVKDSSWINIEKDQKNNLRISVTHHLKATLSLNNQEYEVQCINGPRSFRFCFDSPKIGVTVQNGVKKDSLLFSERMEIGEYLKFGESYYKFEKITNDGREITLIKEEDVSDKIGSQVGFIAPNFQSVTTEGDSLSIVDYRNEYLLLVNLTACWSQPMSYEYYKELSKKYHAKIAIVAIDESPGPLQQNIDQLGLKGKFVISTKNKSIKSNYREDFCSRVCFLIDPSGHIVDKFEIFDWKQSLAEHFE